MWKMGRELQKLKNNWELTVQCIECHLPNPSIVSARTLFLALAFYSCPTPPFFKKEEKICGQWGFESFYSPGPYYLQLFYFPGRSLLFVHIYSLLLGLLKTKRLRI